MNKIIQNKLDNYFSQKPVEKFKKKEIIIAPGKIIKKVYYLKTGLVKQEKLTDNGDIFIAHIFKPVSVFPVMIALNDLINDYYFKALEDLSLQAAESDDMIRFLMNEPDVLFDLTVRLSNGILGLLDRIEAQMFSDNYSKVSSLIYFYSTKYPEGLRFTQSEISSLLGIPRESVTRQITKLTKNNIIKKESNIIKVINKELLKSEILKYSRIK